MAIKNLKTAILSQIIKAQYESDAAKGIKVAMSGLKKDFYPPIRGKDEHYARKDKCIVNALKLIDHNPLVGVKYYIKTGEDQNGYSSNIIYFVIREEGRTLQISFHNFSFEVRENWAKEEKGFYVHWDKKTGGSRESANYLAKKYFSSPERCR